MEYVHITSDRQLCDFCESVADAAAIAFDTEFVSEDSYRPDLCLVQVAAAGRMAVIDPKQVEDLTPFWNLLIEGDRETIVHAGREELRFCLHATGKRPRNLFDVQLAAGMVTNEYPLAYSSLVQKVLDETVPKGETRTNWRRRPLSDRQLEYAMSDVVHLEALREELGRRLEKLQRTQWLAEETAALLDAVESARSSERWRRLSGASGLSRRGLAVLRELWQWRDEEAERVNKPVRRVLRDDLIVELSKRETADVRRIRAVRGMEFRHLQKHVTDIAGRIERAIEIPDSELPRRNGSPKTPEFGLLSRFLATALAAVCQEENIAVGLVGAEQDVRELIAYRFKMRGANTDEESISLLTGWRAEIVGRRLDDLLKGDLSIHIGNPRSDRPLSFERRG